MSAPTRRDDLRGLTGYHSPQVPADVRLNTNEAPEAPPAAFAEAVANAVADIAWHRYPDRQAVALRSGIGNLHGLSNDGVFAANGSNEVLQTILLTFAGFGRSVLTFEPTYALHQHIARISGATVVTGERSADFTLDVEHCVNKIQTVKPAVTFLCSPNNPTGVVDSPDAISRVLSEVEQVGGLLVVDEAYGQFATNSAISLLDQSESLVVTRTYSKTWAMAGARLGYALGNPTIIAELDKVVLPYHLDAVKQAAGIAALEFVDSMDARVAAIVSERGRVETELEKLGCTVWPSGANFVLFRPPNGNGSEVWDALVQRSVLVRNTASWPGLEGSLRVTIGTATDNNRFVEAITEILAAS